jgi:hypothetical protein
MPKSIALKVILWFYIIGYWFNLLFAAAMEWPRLPLMAWVKYVLIQAIHALYWPILIALDLSGFWR